MNHLHPDALFQCTSVEELQSFGKYCAVRKMMQDRMGNRLKYSGRGWKDLHEMLELMRTLSTSQASTAYFTSESARYIYALVELDGAYRLKELGVLKHHYFNKEKARRWRDQIAKVIHPDVCAHPQANTAFAKLEDLYHEMTGA